MLKGCIIGLGHGSRVLIDAFRLNNIKIYGYRINLEEVEVIADSYRNIFLSACFLLFIIYKAEYFHQGTKANYYKIYYIIGIV